MLPNVSQDFFFQFAHDKLSQLPGAAQKVLFRMLEEMANTVYKSNTNEHVFRKLMDELQTTMTIYRVWGSHLGSSQLFKQHLESRRRITEFVEKMQVNGEFLLYQITLKKQKEIWRNFFSKSEFVLFPYCAAPTFFFREIKLCVLEIGQWLRNFSASLGFFFVFLEKKILYILLGFYF